MELVFKHNIKGAFEEVYVEERVHYVSEDAVTKGLRELRKNKYSALWLENIACTSDTNTVSALGIYWETCNDYQNKIATVKYIYGAGYSLSSEEMTWEKAKRIFRQYA